MAGTGTNSGIDYQQSVAASLVIHQYAEIDVSSLLGLDFPGHINELRFETQEPIDDIRLKCTENWEAGIQVKLNLALSTKRKSGFYKCLEQFVQEFLRSPQTLIKFILVTNTGSSQSIRYTLRKIFESVRLNDSNFSNNPLNKQEKKVYANFRETLKIIFREKSGKSITEDQYLQFCSRTYVSIVDIEPGMPIEKAIHLILHAKGFPKPALIWAFTARKCLHLASQRITLNTEGARKFLEQFRVNGNQSSICDDYEISRSGSACSGKELLLVEHPDVNKTYLIVELFRFSDDCSKKVCFTGDQVMLFRDQIPHKVLFRSATFYGMGRFIEDNCDLFVDSKVLIAEANDTEDIEESYCAELYRAHFEELLKSNSNLHLCIHCGRDILDSTSFLIEVDVPDLPATAGFIHTECRLPLDRVIGKGGVKFELEHKLPQRFNLSKWVSALYRGQCFMRTFGDMTVPAGDVTIAWKYDKTNRSNCDYCVSFYLEDGTKKYAFDRGKVHRLSKKEAENYCSGFIERMKMHKAQKDPLGFTSEVQMYGNRSTLLVKKRKSEKFLEIESASVERYSVVLSDIYNTCVDYYAPLGLVVYSNPDEGGFLALSDCVPLLSNPFMFDEFVKNWEEEGYDLSGTRLRTIGSDSEFDQLMEDLFSRNFFPVIDPLFSGQGALLTGLAIVDQDQLMKQSNR